MGVIPGYMNMGADAAMACAVTREGGGGVAVSGARDRGCAQLPRQAQAPTHSRGCSALTPVITDCQLAKAHPEDVELQRKALDRAALGAERAARISGVVLDLARGTSMAGGLAEESAEADLVGVARAVVESLVRDPAKDGIAVRIESVGVERRAKIRPTALHQALLNLVLNGVRALGSGGSLVIRCVDDRSTGWVGIDVEDSGPGIAPEVREKLFSAFASGFRAEGGTGLGLLVVRTLIEDAGGRISVGDAPGGGTVFHVELPAAGAAVARPAA